MDHRHSNEELRKVLGALEATTVPDEQGKAFPRLQPNTKERLIRAIVRRNAELPGLARQAIRLAVALQTTTGKTYGNDWLSLLHGPLFMLRTSRFKTLFEQHPNPNILSTDDPNVYRLNGPGLDAYDGSPFSLDLKRAPSLGGYLDLVCWMLGFEEVMRLVTRAAAEGDAEAPAKEMHGAVLAWLDERLPREHFERQSAVIRGFLEAFSKKDQGHPIKSYLDVNDEVIFSFWEDTGPNGEIIDGFRSWQNTVRLIVAYRAALREAADALAVYGDSQELAEGDDVASPAFGVWLSPLAELTESEGMPPIVKWFSSKEGRGLAATFLTERGPHEGDDDDLPPGNAFADRQPDTMLTLTWLRYIAFGPRQRSRAVGGNVQADGFDASLQRLSAVIEDIERSYAAAIWALLNEVPKIGLTRLARRDSAVVIEAFAQASGVELERVRIVLAAFAEIEKEDPDSFRKVLTELAATGQAGPTRLREAFRVVGQAEVVQADILEDISVKVAKIVEKDREAAHAILKAQTVFAIADDHYGFGESDDHSQKAAEILIQDQTGIQVIDDTRSAYTKINRAGFRKEDRGSEDVIEALRLGTMHLPDILMESSRLERSCQGIDLQTAFADDLVRFEAMFDKLYSKA